ncbi:hypothetical protein AcdelDRAFT_4014 [Acidovorax delafieldii 2AN]|uniref:Uncharacterized protein n=1 Tax=Acidovorax delafieldii 2AN TaxID=573060 RepID=C5TAT4_ACIDE|nr:hypothetical protein [Acidovorax delafieldii]EER58413.1 hypothetical protein AcdelDRAFT_4014 [Acidovorax delafieldii 2AN]
MTKCETCGNEYDGSFEVTLGGTTHTFDSFECAIHAVAPRCAQCSVPIVGHGVQAGAQLATVLLQPLRRRSRCARAAGPCVSDGAAVAVPRGARSDKGGRTAPAMVCELS